MWTCEYCSCVHPSDVFDCKSCGAARAAKSRVLESDAEVKWRLRNESVKNQMRFLTANEARQVTDTAVKGWGQRVKSWLRRDVVPEHDAILNQHDPHSMMENIFWPVSRRAS